MSFNRICIIISATVTTTTVNKPPFNLFVMSTLSRKDYFINLRKSYHVHFNVHSTSETLIFIDEKTGDSAESISNL